MDLLPRKVNISIIHPRELGSGKSSRTSIPTEGARWLSYDKLAGAKCIRLDTL